MTKLTPGDEVPKFKTVNQHNQTVNLKDLKAKKIVLYFYPKDDTPTCTTEACNLRDNYHSLLAKGFTIFGISPDNSKKHLKFIEKFELPFDLLVDEDHSIAEAFGVWIEKSMYGRKYMGVARVTFVIKKGVIIDIIEKVDSKNHANQLVG